jgi:hypothetical protein
MWYYLHFSFALLVSYEKKILVILQWRNSYLQFSNSLTLSFTNQLTQFNSIDSVMLRHLGTDCTENTVPLLLCNCFRGNMLVCEAVTQQRLLYRYLFRGRCLATGLHGTILYREITAMWNLRFSRCWRCDAVFPACYLVAPFTLRPQGRGSRPFIREVAQLQSD